MPWLSWSNNCRRSLTERRCRKMTSCFAERQWKLFGRGRRFPWSRRRHLWFWIQELAWIRWHIVSCALRPLWISVGAQCWDVKNCSLVFLFLAAVSAATPAARNIGIWMGCDVASRGTVASHVLNGPTQRVLACYHAIIFYIASVVKMSRTNSLIQKQMPSVGDIPNGSWPPAKSINWEL